MAKRSKIAKNEQRRTVVARYAERRAELERVIAAPSTTPEDRLAAQQELRRQPRDASATRVRNRDTVDGRPGGYLRVFGLSRIVFTQHALPAIRPVNHIVRDGDIIVRTHHGAALAAHVQDSQTPGSVVAYEGCDRDTCQRGNEMILKL